MQGSATVDGGNAGVGIVIGIGEDDGAITCLGQTTITANNIRYGDGITTIKDECAVISDPAAT